MDYLTQLMQTLFYSHPTEVKFEKPSGYKNINSNVCLERK